MEPPWRSLAPRDDWPNRLTVQHLLCLGRQASNWGAFLRRDLDWAPVQQVPRSLVVSERMLAGAAGARLLSPSSATDG